MVRAVDQREAFTNCIIPRELSEKAIAILSDERNYLSSKEVDSVQRTFVNSSKNLRQIMSVDKYNITSNRCSLFMDYSSGLRNIQLLQHELDIIIYHCCTLHIVSRTRRTLPGNYENHLK